MKLVVPDSPWRIRGESNHGSRTVGGVARGKGKAHRKSADGVL